MLIYLYALIVSFPGEQNKNRKNKSKKLEVASSKNLVYEIDSPTT